MKFVKRGDLSFSEYPKTFPPHEDMADECYNSAVFYLLTERFKSINENGDLYPETLAALHDWYHVCEILINDMVVEDATYGECEDEIIDMLMGMMREDFNNLFE